ncbi:MAG TPA: OmpA family protein [Bryobacteraceae bacterium]|nr:OmpA family protein [Bryobacteraceae bacterium]
MKTTAMLAGALMMVSLAGTGCATKKYVAKTIAPVEQRVSGTENKNADQDKAIADTNKNLGETDRDLSRTKEKLNDTDTKATQAGEAAKAADQKAGEARTAADGAQHAADDAKNFAQTGLDRMDQKMIAMNKFNMAKSVTVLFKVNSATLTADGKQELDDLAKQATSTDRFVIEVQGFTDKTGSPDYNNVLSERRAESVARYLTNQGSIPVRSINMLGEGYAQPVADDKTRDGRKQNRRVEVKLWTPEASADHTVASNGSQQ